MSINSMSRRCEVIVQYSDLGGLAAVAAGASAVGSGWDLRQRMFAPDAFRLTTTIRRTAHRITYEGLLAVLKRAEAERLLRNNRPLSSRLVPGPLPPNGNSLWDHHLTVLANEVSKTAGGALLRDRAAALAARYAAAQHDFAIVEGSARPLEAGSAAWLGALSNGLATYVAGEGW